MVKFGGIGTTPTGGPSLRGRARRIRNTDFADLEAALENQSLSETERRLLEGRERRARVQGRTNARRREKLRPKKTLQAIDIVMLLMLGVALAALIGLALIVLFS